MLGLKNDILLNFLISGDFWYIQWKVSFLKKAEYKIESIITSTYLYESLFSNSNLLESSFWFRLTNKHLYNCLLVGLWPHSPNYEALVNNMQCNRSHWHINIIFLIKCFLCICFWFTFCKYIFYVYKIWMIMYYLKTFSFTIYLQNMNIRK